MRVIRTFPLGLKIVCILAIAVPAARAGGPAPLTVRVAVASNFAAPLEELAAIFEKNVKHGVKASPGSTGKLVAQIKNGGPFDVFLSADAASVVALVEDGFAEKDSRITYAIGRLALYAPSAPVVDKDFLRSTAIKHLAIANPKTAPYGVAAMEALRKSKLTDTFTNNMVYGENIAQTFQFVESGAAEAGFVAYGQVIERDVKTFWIVPEDWHSPIRQDACLLAHGKDNGAARDFLRFLQSDEARKVVESFGYGVERKAEVSE